MKITAVVRTNDRREFLKECLSSISIQSHTDWEVLIFDDGRDEDNYKIYRDFRSHHPDKRVLYITTFTPLELFKKSWDYAVILSDGEIIFRIDDDDLLCPHSFESISKIYDENPLLDFSFGSSATFSDEDKKINWIFYNKTPGEYKTRNAWDPYLNLESDKYMWWIDHYPEEIEFSSIVHASRAKIMTLYHPYVMRKRSLLKMGEIPELTSNFFDDLEFMSQLEYSGLTYSSIKKVLIFCRSHSRERRMNQSGISYGTNLFSESERIRNLCDLYRPANFSPSVIGIQPDESTEDEIQEMLDETIVKIETKIEEIFKK
jgi:glycosyltransferase involved in cell wall biosynthesis